MKKDWTYKKLGEVAEIHDSLRKPVTKKDRRPGPYPYYGATGIQDYVDEYIFDGRYVLVGEDGAKWSSNEKSAYIIEGKSWVNNHAHVITFDKSVIDRFAVYFLNYSNLDPYITGAIIKKLTQKDLLSISIPIPPLSIQRSIVAELDLLHSVISKKKEQLRELDNLAQSLFYQMFGDPITNPMGWETKKLGEVCVFSQGMQAPIEEQCEECREGLVRFLRIIDFTQGTDAPRYVECKDDKYILHDKEIAIVRYGTPGFVCYGKYGAIANNLFKITPVVDGLLNYSYFIHWLSSDAFQMVVKGNQYGAALQAIKFSTIQNISTILPPLSLQQSFAAKVSAIEAQKHAITLSIKETEALLAQRMDTYFS